MVELAKVEVLPLVLETLSTQVVMEAPAVVVRAVAVVLLVQTVMVPMVVTEAPAVEAEAETVVVLLVDPLVMVVTEVTTSLEAVVVPDKIVDRQRLVQTVVVVVEPATPQDKTVETGLILQQLSEAAEAVEETVITDLVVVMVVSTVVEVEEPGMGLLHQGVMERKVCV